MIEVRHIGLATLYRAKAQDVLPLIDGVDLVATDPPYGGKFSSHAYKPTKRRRSDNLIPERWDAATLPEIVCSLPRIAKYAIVWGGNLYPLPQSRGWLSWYKPDAPPSQAHFELAWTSIDMNARQIRIPIAEVNPERNGHPTQKPLRLMKWCLSFASDAETVFDPFMGSGTTGVAAVQMGKRFIGVENCDGYYEMACARIEQAQRQSCLFDPAELVSARG